MSEQARDTTPLMQQYFRIRAEFPEVLLLFQVGDFYELFFDDAVKAAKVLNIVLTKRGTHQGTPIPLCGVPVHALDNYLTKLVKAGFQIAVCDQLEPAQVGKVVQRGVTRVLTPGTLTELNLLDDKSASYLLSFFPSDNSNGSNGEWALLFGELLTAQLYATKITNNLLKSLESELGRFFPDEILLPKSPAGQKFNSYFKQLGYITSLVNSQETQGLLIDHASANSPKSSNILEQDLNPELNFESWLNTQFDQNTQNLIQQNQTLKIAILNFYNYLAQRQNSALSQFKSVKFYNPEDFLILDHSTQQNLELFKNSYDQTRKHSLLDQLDQTVTPMGARMVSKWLARPLVSLTQIQQRQLAIKTLLVNLSVIIKLQAQLAKLGDLERIVGRIGLRRAGLGDYLQLLTGLQVIPEIKILIKNLSHARSDTTELNNFSHSLLTYIQNNLGEFSLLTNLLLNSLNQDSQNNWVIKAGFNLELDYKRNLITQASQKILDLEQQEQARTGLSSLKIRFNSIHGYYIEITKANLHLAPPDYLRLQTLVNCERFVSPKLQELQAEITSAQSAIGDLENLIFGQIKAEVELHLANLRKTAQALANLDAILSFAQVAHESNYICPEFNLTREIIIQAGRHPIVENLVSQTFVPNHTNLTDQSALYIITGPNMGGKSTYLRQVALITIMAQCGSFVPADGANLSLVDRIFTRIGAGDYLSQGKSTFLVEMEETALICQLATQNSLVILDEVGRGTSTFDGLAIAQAVVEYIYQTIGARCLFATHYHELTELNKIYPGIINYYAKSQKTAQGIIFLHEIVPGVADSSFGVEVAKLANLPAPVILRAQAILNNLTKHQNKLTISHLSQIHHPPLIPSTESNINSDLNLLVNKATLPNFQPASLIHDQIINQLKSLELNDLTPRQALELLWKFNSDLI
jgi:DNA mismatch repair protein MutS